MCGGVIEDIGSGISDVASGVGDAVSGAVSSVSDTLASIDPGPAIGQAAASIDPGPAIGETLAQVDEAVNDLPGGWALPAAIAATIAAPYAAPALAEAFGGAALAAEAAAPLTTAEILAGAGGTFTPTAGYSFTLPAFEALGTTALEGAAPSLLSTAAEVAAETAAPSLFSSAEIASNVSALAEYGLAPEQISLALQAEGIPVAVANQAAGIASAEAATGAITQALPYTEAYDAANLFQNGITNANQIGDIMAATGLDPFIASDLGSLAAQGLSEAQLGQVIGASYTPAELAGTGFKSLNWAAPATLGLMDLLGSPFGKLLGGNVAKGLLGGGIGSGGRALPLQAGQSTSYNPRGAVDYSGILGLISPQLAKKQTSRTSLLG